MPKSSGSRFCKSGNDGCPNTWRYAFHPALYLLFVIIFHSSFRNSSLQYPVSGETCALTEHIFPGDIETRKRAHDTERKVFRINNFAIIHHWCKLGTAWTNSFPSTSAISSKSTVYVTRLMNPMVDSWICAGLSGKPKKRQSLSRRLWTLFCINLISHLTSISCRLTCHGSLRSMYHVQIWMKSHKWTNDGQANACFTVPDMPLAYSFVEQYGEHNLQIFHARCWSTLQRMVHINLGSFDWVCSRHVVVCFP